MGKKRRFIFGWRGRYSIMTARCNVKSSLVQVFPNKPFVFQGPRFFSMLAKYFNPRELQYTSGNQNPFDCIYLAKEATI